MPWQRACVHKAPPPHPVERAFGGTLLCTARRAARKSGGRMPVTLLEAPALVCARPRPALEMVFSDLALNHSKSQHSEELGVVRAASGFQGGLRGPGFGHRV